MRLPVLASAAVIALLLTGCGKKEESVAEAPTAADWDAGAKDMKAEGGDLAIDADVRGGAVDVRLPGGFEAKVKLPDGMAAGIGDTADFDIDGVGRYPGSQIETVKVRAGKREGGKDSLVEMGFTAPAAPEVVADWYEERLKAKGHTVSRDGDTLSGTMKDGEAFTMRLDRKGEGTTGLVTITKLREAA
jgi:hypothetical protein